MEQIQLEEDEPKFYMQDARQIVGNSMLLWARGRNGYTTDLEKAHVFTESELGAESWRPTDHAWPKEYLDSKVVRMVDMQYVAPAFRKRIKLYGEVTVQTDKQPEL